MRLSNLTANGKLLAYLHEGTLVALPDAAVVASAKDQHHTRLREPTGASFHSVRFLPPPLNLLAAASETALHLFSAANLARLHSLPYDALEPSPPRFSHLRGIASLVASADGALAYIFVGTSEGSLIRLCYRMTGEPFASPTLLRGVAKGPVVDLDAGAHQGQRVLAVAVGPSEGGFDAARVLLLSVSAAGELEPRHAIRLGALELCHSLRFREGALVCAQSTGAVRVFDVEAGRPIALIKAHARSISALEFHPSKPIFATASEDCTIGLFSIAEAPHRVAHIAHIEAPDCILAGVAFCGGAPRDFVAASAYDTDSIQAWAIAG